MFSLMDPMPGAIEAHGSEQFGEHFIHFGFERFPDWNAVLKHFNLDYQFGICVPLIITSLLLRFALLGKGRPETMIKLVPLMEKTCSTISFI